MTIAETTLEWEFRRDEYLAILCNGDKPTPAQRLMAIREANEAILRLNEADQGVLI